MCCQIVLIIVTTPVNNELSENKSLFIYSYRYREASQRVFKVLSEFSLFVERASIDEAYIDLTNAVNDHISSNHNLITESDLPYTFVQGYSDQSSKGNFVYTYTQRLPQAFTLAEYLVWCIHLFPLKY